MQSMGSSKAKTHAEPVDLFLSRHLGIRAGGLAHGRSLSSIESKTKNYRMMSSTTRRFSDGCLRPGVCWRI